MPKGAGSKTAELAVNGSTPLGLATHFRIDQPPWVRALVGLDRAGYRIVPTAIVEGTALHGTRQERLRRRFAIEQARLWTRTAPDLRRQLSGRSGGLAAVDT
ncbi:hypothetical protein GCM10009534_66650 [Kribbella sandramycini]